jgi:Protein of unknown function (DUF4241)
MNNHHHLEDAFSKLSIQNIGKLRITTGNLIVCDGFNVFDPSPFNIQFPIGEFPIELAIIINDNIEQAAFARISFSQKSPIAWHKAITEEQSKRTTLIFKPSGFAVDSGMAAIMDLAGAQEFKEEVINNNGFDYLLSELDEKADIGWIYHELKYVKDNIFIFSSGVGNGRYQTYIGINEDKDISRLIIDFNLVS